MRTRLYAANCVFDLVHFDVFQLVDEQALVVVGLCEEDESESKGFATGRVETIPWEAVHGAIADKAVVADGFLERTSRICDIRHSSCDNPVAVIAHLLRLGFAAAGDKRSNIEASRALVISVVLEAHPVIWVRLDVRQEGEVNPLIVLRAIVEDSEYVRQ